MKRVAFTPPFGCCDNDRPLRIMPIEARISVVSSESASNSLYTYLKLSKLSFISLTGMSSMNSDADLARVARAFPLVV